MFRSIEYRLITYLILLVVSAVAATIFYIRAFNTGEQLWYAMFFTTVTLFSIHKLWFHYRKYNKNIVFLLNALDNGDNTYTFATTKLSRREKELNMMLNRIKEILEKARNEVIENEKFLSVVIESVSTGIIIATDRDSIRAVNRSAQEMLGLTVFTHLKQLSAIDSSLPGLFINMKDHERASITVSNEREEYRISVEMSQIVVNSKTLHIYALNNIGNELEATEMESWIKLIRVMTHEIMNSIAPVTSLSETLLSAYGDKTIDPDLLKENTVEAFRTINSTARGLLSFVDSYRSFTRIPKPAISNIDTVNLLNNAGILASHLIDGKSISIDTIAPDEPVIINADEGQVMQVLVNLIKNAVEAIGNSDSGRIVVELKNDPHDTRLTVTNNGEPIPADIAAHIFVPFFTTKQNGTGIGLSLSRYIMRLHGGNLKHHTENGKTVFSMVFPSAQ